MNMKEHILAALKEKFEEWENLLANLGEEQITSPQFDDNWSIKDVMAHLWAWQQISIARTEAFAQNREPEFPKWVLEIDDWEEDADQVNAVTYKNNHQKPWSEVHQNWKEGFLLFLKSAEPISERDLLDGDKFEWLHGHSLAAYLIASYDHHQEHYEKLTGWLNDNDFS